MGRLQRYSRIREIRKIDLVTYFYIPPLIIAVIWVIYGLLIYPHLGNYRFIFLAVFIISTYILFRRFLIGMVLMYKAFAPMEVRKQCRYNPTCSTYMIMAIQKFGIVVGVTKGIKRIKRCKPPNGGDDYP
ncbi:MAG: membrane protein insertion efficiency factor YidD [Bacilli bacterium]|nr:membrane protein insertion efficiency factor YidD [Bacilli bacterium]